MKQRGRKSAANLATLIDVTGTPPRLTTPAGLAKDERSLFDFIVDASPPHHFTGSDQPLLVSYVQACLMARSAAKTPAKIAIFERVVRLQAMLATKLRLSPQTRLDPKTLARHYANFDPNAPTPWAWEERDDAA
jgi:hypothetical protein